MAKYVGPERRVHLNVRKLADNAPVIVRMVRKLAPDRLHELDAKLEISERNALAAAGAKTDAGGRPIDKQDVIEYGYGYRPTPLQAMEDAMERRVREDIYYGFRRRH